MEIWRINGTDYVYPEPDPRPVEVAIAFALGNVPPDAWDNATIHVQAPSGRGWGFPASALVRAGEDQPAAPLPRWIAPAPDPQSEPAG